MNVIAAVRTDAGKTMPYMPYTYKSPDDPAREDEGLFGRESVTWRVMSSRIMWVAVVRALYLQALHPRVIRGTLQNAATITQPVDAWARLRRTRKFIETRTFGTMAEAEGAGRRVRKIHESLTGTDPDGTRYRVDEPELLLWVHCGEVSSCADVARRSRLPFSAADLDSFVDEQRTSAELIGVDRAAAPASMAELDAYYEEIRPRLSACDEARQALRLTFRPPVPDGNRVLKLGLPPVSADTRSHAATRNAGSKTRLNRSPKRREGFSPAQRCNLICILRTVTPARAGPGQHTAPVFTSASSDIAFPP